MDFCRPPRRSAAVVEPAVGDAVVSMRPRVFEQQQSQLFRLGHRRVSSSSAAAGAPHRRAFRRVDVVLSVLGPYDLADGRAAVE